QPRLVPQDKQTWAVYQRLEIRHFLPAVHLQSMPRSSLPASPLEFVGKWSGKGHASFLLLYPSAQAAATSAPALPAEAAAAALIKRSTSWIEVPLELDLNNAVAVAPSGIPEERRPEQAPTRDDLEGLWAEAQVARFAVLEALTPEFGFYGFACAATGRKYGVAAPALGAETGDKELLHRRLYETTTGASAITESLQLHRLLGTPTLGDRGQRTVDIWSVPGIDIAEHPWEKMMAGKKPTPEPLARLVPRDNYYVHFKNIRKFIEFSELLDQWGTNLARAYEMSSRDFQLKERYERQLCLKSTWLGKTLGPALLRGLAVTGNDPYLREGTDVAVIFHVANRPLFLAAVNGFIQEARARFKDQLREGKADYHGVAVETFVTPLREVSLYRAALGDFVIYANSPTGLRRVLDAQHGRLPALADALDFQYMRTVFRLEDKQEDGFAFLSDAFIRQLVGPAGKIKEKRRLEALTSLSMVTNAALFAAWESGDLPADQAAMLAGSALKPRHIYVPEGKGVTWDAATQAAVSDAYNTFHFTTPLIELPIDKITPAEQQEYNQFRTAYLNLWRQYFDPVGMRFALDDKQVRMETYILPLIRDSRYASLRQHVGGGATAFDPGTISPNTLLQLAAFIAPNGPDFLGDQAILRLDDDSTVRKLVDYWMARQMQNPAANGWEEYLAALRLALQLPLTAGVRIKDPVKFDEEFKYLQQMLQANVPYTARPIRPEYKGVPITRVQFAPGGSLAEFLKMRKPPDLYHARIDDWWYVSLREAPLKELIDRSVARREGKEPKPGETVPINLSVYAGPRAATKARDALRYYLEWESQRRALPNCTAWYALYHCGLVATDAPEKTRQAAALRYFGFAPVSPDGAAYGYDPRTDEVVNRRHGSPRRPQL
ncbi:MAG TPA: hypothetical protein VKI17_11485, partial [Gemmataceae bacterium]|nr:hypothetical protein [Gemmataceae bacterium]